MPVVKSLMSALRGRYGAKKGERVYYAMEAEGKGPFAKGNKHHDLHVAYAQKLGAAPIERSRKPGTKKPRRRSSGPTTPGHKRRG